MKNDCNEVRNHDRPSRSSGSGPQARQYYPRLRTPTMPTLYDTIRWAGKRFLRRRRRSCPSSVSSDSLRAYSHTDEPSSDLAGHERYLKTTLYGLTSGAPSCVILIVGGNAGLIGMSKEHLAIALALSVPVVVCITKAGWYQLRQSCGP